MMLSSSIWSSSALYKGITCTGTLRGACMTGFACSLRLMWYFAPGNRPTLSKQSAYCSSTDFLVRTLFAATSAVLLNVLLNSLMQHTVGRPVVLLNVTRFNSCAYLHPISDGLPVDRTSRKSVTIDLSKHDTLTVTVPRYLIAPPP